MCDYVCGCRAGALGAHIGPVTTTRIRATRWLIRSECLGWGLACLRGYRLLAPCACRRLSYVGVDGTRAVLDAKHSACCMHATAPLGNPCRNQGGATHQEPVATSASTRCLVRAAKPATRPPGAGTARVAIVIVRIPGDMGNHPCQLLHPKVCCLVRALHPRLHA